MDNLKRLTAVELGRKIKSGEVRVVDAVKSVLEEIQGKEPLYHCYVTLPRKKNVCFHAQRSCSRKLTPESMRIPCLRCSCGCQGQHLHERTPDNLRLRMLADFIPAYSAEVMERLEKAGMLLIGKTNMDEFAMGNTTETSAFGVTKNPYNTEHVPGGSSGGSAAAVAAGECYAALGSDTGGSVRQPASFCGVVGMKPTYGTVSRHGLVAYASSFDQIGPMTKDVTDCAVMLDIIAGKDDKDSTLVEFWHRAEGAEGENTFTAALKNDVTGLRIGLPRDYFEEGLDEEVKKKVISAAQVFKEAGAVVEEFDLGLVRYAVPAYYIIASAEASSNLSRFDGVKYGYRATEYEGLHEMYKKSRSEGFGKEVKRRLLLGSYALSDGYYDMYYEKALRVRRLIKQEFDRAFQNYDLILGPVAPGTAPRLLEEKNIPLQNYLADVYTVSANLLGLPAISIPCGTDAAGLPVGMQLTGNCFEDMTVLRAAYTYEQRTGENT